MPPPVVTIPFPPSPGPRSLSARALQVQLLHSLFAIKGIAPSPSSVSARTSIEISSVDGFQGREKEVRMMLLLPTVDAALDTAATGDRVQYGA